MDYEGSTPLAWLVYAGNITPSWLVDAVSTQSENLAATEAFLRQRGAKEDTIKGITRAWIWILTYSRLIRHIRPRI